MENAGLILETAAYIENHLDENLTLDRIAGQVHYSKYHLNRLFARTTGSTIYKYIQRRRITEAARHLTETTRPIADIAMQAGYHSQQSFTQAFRQIYGYTPMEYRNAGIFRPKQMPWRIQQDRNTLQCRGTAA